MRRNHHVLTVTGRLAAERFKRAQLFHSSPSLGPRSFATRSRKGLVSAKNDEIELIGKMQNFAEISAKLGKV